MSVCCLCKVCERYFSGTEKSWIQHTGGKKHFARLPDSLTVTGYFAPEYLGELHTYIAQFGEISSHTVSYDNGTTSVDYVFKDKRSSTQIIQNRHTFLNTTLEISWQRPKQLNPFVRPPVVKQLVPSLPTQGNHPAAAVERQDSKQGPTTEGQDSKQFPTIEGQDKGRMTAPTETSKYVGIVASLKGGKTFDEQLNLLLNKLQVNKIEVENNRKLIHNDLMAAFAYVFSCYKIQFFGSSITGLDVQGSDLDVFVSNVRHKNKSEIATLKTLRTLIYKCHKFCDVLLIAGASVPIIKCIHTKTQICCDLNVRNKLSVNNSELIKYYLSLDEKVRPLMILIKFWAEFCSLKKINFFSSYALYLMVVFYLQQEPYNIPSVVDLQKDTPPDIVDGWNCAFTQNAYESQALRSQSFMQLACGFFKFYGNFDYTSLVICPYTGSSIPKLHFIKPFSLPTYYEAYMNQHQTLGVHSGMCIQDPFEHGRNVASSVPLQTVGKFITLCNVAALPSQNGDNLLHRLLLTCVKHPTKFSCFHVEKNVACNDQLWIQIFKNIMNKVLREVLNCELNEVPTKDQDTVTYDCTGKFNVWDNRVSIMKNIMPQLSPEVDELTKEIAVTSWILKHFPPALSTKLMIRLNFAVIPCKVEIIMKTGGKTKSVLHISQFLRIKLAQFMNEAEQKIGNSNNTNQSCAAKHTGTVESTSQFVTKAEIGMAISNNTKAEQPTTMTENHGVPGKCAAVDAMINTNDKISTNSNRNNANLVGKQVDHSTLPFTSDLQTQSAVEQLIVHSDNVKTTENSGDGAEEKSKSEEDGELPEDDEEEEDVPADFFDDFSNQDFMDGLDIVDAWDEGSKPPTEEGALADNKKVETSDKKPHSPIKFVSNRSSDGRVMRKYADSRSPLRRKKRSSSYTRRRSRSSSRSRDKIRGADVRRDPEKTRRDISRDKLKCARDKEQKLVSDKLKIVETGLVPPGTEMEVDITSIMKEKQRPSGGSIERARERDRRYPRRSGSREPRNPIRYSRSPVYRARNRERMEMPYRVRRRLSSVDSNASERELWIRSSRKRSRSKDSPLRSKQRKYEEKKKKKTFLEEIRDKLNEVRPTPVIQYSHPGMSTFNSAMPHPIPAPVPAPVTISNQFFPQPQSNPGIQQYDQHFFIGDAYPINPPNMIMNQPQSIEFNMLGNVVPMPHARVASVAPMQPSGPVAPLSSPAQHNVPVPSVEKNSLFPHTVPIQKESVMKLTEMTNIQASNNIDKLFADKKISLTDFLTITAKCEVQSSSPEHLQKKIYVISRCQDAIKAMSDDRKFSGRLTVKPSVESKIKSDVKYQSPLRRIPVVRFQFTSPAKASEELDGFAGALDKILEKIGVLTEIIDLEDSVDKASRIPSSSFVDEDTTLLTLRAGALEASKKAVCEECKKRKSKTFVEVGSQCTSGKQTVSIGVQVSEDELTPTKGLLKNDSIAYLTPAQLLEKEMEKESSPTTTTGEKTIENKNDEPATVAVTNKKQKSKTAFRSRGGFRKTFRDRPYNYNAEELEFYERDRLIFEEGRENFTNRYGPSGSRFSRKFEEEEHPPERINVIRDEDPMFLDFNTSYRGRKPNRFGPRY